jgi:hypothetical protein
MRDGAPRQPNAPARSPCAPTDIIGRPPVAPGGKVVIRFSLFAFGLAALVGCGTTPPTPHTEMTRPSEKGHVHPETGPAGGVLASWGNEEYHAELVVDQPTGEATVYLLDGTAKKVTPIETKTVTLSLKETPSVVVTLEAKPQDGDPPGRSSRFVGRHDALKAGKEFSGSISGKAGGKNYTGDFAPKPASKK